MIRGKLNVQPDGEISAELQAAFSQAGVSISSDQLRRWRDQGLMPPAKQVGLGRAAGSITLFPLGTAKLAIEIKKLLGVKKKLDFVGWNLWMQGYEVDKRYWKPSVQSAAKELKRIPAWLRLMESRYQTDEESIFDLVPPAQFEGSPLAKGLAKLEPEMRASILGFIADVAQGRFKLSNVGDKSDDKSNRKAIVKSIGQSRNRIVAGILPKKDFESELENQLLNISQSMLEIQNSPIEEVTEISASARMEFLVLLDLASRLSSMSAQFAKSPIGRFPSAIMANQDVQAYALIIWTVFRNNPQILTAPEILELLNSINLETLNNS